MAFRFLLLIVLLAASCALPRSSSSFSVPAKSVEGEDIDFLSSDELMVSGVVTEGMSFVKRGRLFDAENRMRKALYLNPSNPRIEFNLAAVLVHTEQADEALTIAQKLLSREPNNPTYLQLSAEILSARGEHEQALEVLKRAFFTFKSAGNYQRAAVLARSIANISFGIGSESEALCYSYEAAALSPDPTQVSQHGRLLLSLNLYPQAEAVLRGHRAAMNDALAQHVVALARFARGDESGALEAAELAMGRSSQSVDLSAEITAAWWLLKRRAEPGVAINDESAEGERMAQLQKDVVAFRDSNPYYLVSWPPALRRALNEVKAPVE